MVLCGIGSPLIDLIHCVPKREPLGPPRVACSVRSRYPAAAVVRRCAPSRQGSQCRPCIRSKDTDGENPQVLGHSAFLGMLYAKYLHFLLPPAHSVAPSLCRGAGDCHFAVLSSDKMEALEESATTTACAFQNQR